MPQAHVLGHCDLVVCHGGSGTVLAALAAGIPVVIVPQGADQFRNAPFWQASGAAVVSPVERLDGHLLRTALVDGRGNGPLRRAAHRVRDAIAAMPPPAATADRLEAMVE